MALYHFSVKTISRANGRSATAAAAYRAGEKIHDDRTGETFDYTRKSGILVSAIVAPQGIATPEWANDRPRLWNEAEKAETRINSRVAREAEIALPHELTPEQREALTRSVAQHIADRYKVPVDYSIHEPARNGDDRNHHAHILFATREIGPEGFGKKTRVLDAHETGPDEIDKLREDFAGLVNRAYEQAGLSQRVDPRTLEAQGIDREPTYHLGPDATALERKNQPTALGDFNRAAAQTHVQEDRASQPKQSGDLSRKERRDLVANLYSQSDGPAAFQQALADHGFILTTGDRRPFILTDSRGATHNLARLVPESTNDSLRDYLAPIADRIPPAGQTTQPEQQHDPLTPTFNEAAHRPQPELKPRLTATFNQEAKAPDKSAPNEQDIFFENLKQNAVARMTAEYQSLLEKQGQRTDELEARWDAQIKQKMEELAARQDARRQQEEEARQPNGLAALFERVMDTLEPERIETRRREAARIEALTQEREASERLALDAKLQEVLEKNRQKLEAGQQQHRTELDHRHEVEIAKLLQQEHERRKILEDYHRQKEARSSDLTREDNERYRGRDR